MTGAPDLDHTLGELRHLCPSYPQRSKVRASDWIATDLLMAAGVVLVILAVFFAPEILPNGVTP